MENLFLANKYKINILVFKKKSWIPSMISLSLIGCGSPISTVKDSYIDERQMTTSQLLDNRKICSNIKWNNFEDKNNRKIVEYKCTFVDTKDFLAKARTYYFTGAREDRQKKIEESKNKINAMEEEISNLTSEISGANTSLESESESEKNISPAEKKRDKIKFHMSLEKENLSFLERAQKFDEEKIKKVEPYERFPKYEKIVEKFKWVVNKNNEPKLLYGELIAIAPSMEGVTFGEVTNKNGDIVIPQDKVLAIYDDPKTILLEIPRIDAKDHAAYIRIMLPHTSIY